MRFGTKMALAVVGMALVSSLSGCACKQAGADPAVAAAAGRAEEAANKAAAAAASAAEAAKAAQAAAEKAAAMGKKGMYK